MRAWSPGINPSPRKKIVCKKKIHKYHKRHKLLTVSGHSVVYMRVILKEQLSEVAFRPSTLWGELLLAGREERGKKGSDFLSFSSLLAFTLCTFKAEEIKSSGADSVHFCCVCTCILYTMYYVLCTMYYVLCTMHYALCTMYYALVITIGHNDVLSSSIAGDFVHIIVPYPLRTVNLIESPRSAFNCESITNVSLPVTPFK